MPQCHVLEPLDGGQRVARLKEALAIQAGYEAGGGSFNNTLGSRRWLSIIDYPGRS